MRKIMGDCAKCDQEDCPKSNTCFRFLAESGNPEHQVYFAPPYDESGCDEYWEAE